MNYSATIKDTVKESVKIPKYFYEIIVPQNKDYYSDYTIDFDLEPVVKCPLHDENTPSMRYYPETNTFYCFGCGKGGDIITLHREYVYRTTGSYPKFNETVSFLYNYFILDRQQEAELKYKVPEKEEKSEQDKIEQARYYLYASKLEKQLLVDNSMNFENKVKIWDLLDNLSILVEKGFINARAARESLNEYIIKGSA